jgi:hypothetical protein
MSVMGQGKNADLKLDKVMQSDLSSTKILTA